MPNTINSSTGSIYGKNMSDSDNDNDNDGDVALLVIDIQEECTGPFAKPEYSYSEADQLIVNTNVYIERAQGRGDLIVYIKHEDHSLLRWLLAKLFFWMTTNESIGLDIDSRINQVSSHVISKHRQSAFSNPRLDVLLQEYKIKKVELVGLDAAYCVQETAFDGSDKGYQVLIYTDAVVTNNVDRWKQLKEKLCQKGVLFESVVE